MKFIHIADVHLGACPDAGSACSKTRSKELWESFAKIVEICNRERADVLLIAGDLFHRQPLLRELKEVNSILSNLENTKVVIIAGNHDYIRSDSYYRTFRWAEHITFLKDEEMSCIEYPQLELAVYGFSYHSREITEFRYDQTKARHRQKYEILLAHGGDEKHIPIGRRMLESLEYDYIALGHIHKPGIIRGVNAAYAGALEPVDKNDTGSHGYILGELTDQGCNVRFIPHATRSYLQEEIPVDKEMAGYDVRNAIRERIEQKGVQNLYQIRLAGYRDPDIQFNVSGMDMFGNILEIRDDTKPAYDFQRLSVQNQHNLLGSYIDSFHGCDPDSLEYEALCEGVQALMETRRS